MGNYLINSLGASTFIPNRYRAKLLRALGLKAGQRLHIHDGVRFRKGDITIGVGVFINRGSSIDPGDGSISIGDNVSIGESVRIAAASYSIGSAERRASGNTSSHISIGAGTWIGAGVIVLPGVNVAPGNVIGAGAVVAADTEPNAVYAGVPARLIRRLD